MAYYPFNGNADVESGNTCAGIAAGAELTADAAGNPQGAYEFDGTGFIGTVDEVRIFNQALSDMEIFAFGKTGSSIGNAQLLPAEKFQYFNKRIRNRGQITSLSGASP